LKLYDVWWNGSSWQDSQLSTTALSTEPAALYGFAQGRMDVFYRAKDGYLWDTWWNGSSWQVSKLSNVRVNSIPAPLYGFSSGRMDVFYKGPTGTL
jgi:hypothetical protein